MGPDYNDSLTLPNGVEVPIGPQIEYKDYDPSTSNANYPLGTPHSVQLQHNEFVVYNNAQIRMRYLVQVVRKTKEELREDKLRSQ